MKTVVVLVAILIGSAVTTHAQETCSTWNQWSDDWKGVYLAGMLQGIQGMAALSALLDSKDNGAEEANKIRTEMAHDALISRMWPKGHRVGSVLLEMDVECTPLANRNQSTGVSLSKIANRLNKR